MRLCNLFESGRKYKIVTGKKPDDFVTYLRSESMVRDALSEIYSPGIANSPKLDYIIGLFAHHNMVLVDSIVMDFEPDEVWEYREYDRDPSSGFTGKLDSIEYTELKSDIEENGVKNPISLTMERLKSGFNDGDVKVYLGEGNHRLRIARELGLDKIPVRFNYYK